MAAATLTRKSICDQLMSKKRKRRGLFGVGAFLGTLLVMAELVGGSALPTDLVSFIESGKTVWVGGVAVLLSASWLIYDLSENGWADRPVLETVLRYSDRGLFPEPNELASLVRDPKRIEILKEMSADPSGSIISTATLGMSPAQQKHRALVEQLVDAGLAEWRSHEKSIARITSRGCGVLDFLKNGRSNREPRGAIRTQGFNDASS